MRPILLDTNTYAAFKRGDAHILELLQVANEIAITPIVIGELLAGFNSGTRPIQNKKELQEFLENPRIKIHPITADTAIFFGHIHYLLRCKGKPIPTNDMWIAAQALENGCFLCTYDKHFETIDGLTIVKTAAELMY